MSEDVFVEQAVALKNLIVEWVHELDHKERESEREREREREKEREREVRMSFKVRMSFSRRE